MKKKPIISMIMMLGVMLQNEVHGQRPKPDPRQSDETTSSSTETADDEQASNQQDKDEEDEDLRAVVIQEEEEDHEALRAAVEDLCLQKGEYAIEVTEEPIKNAEASSGSGNKNNNNNKNKKWSQIKLSTGSINRGLKGKTKTLRKNYNWQLKK